MGHVKCYTYPGKVPLINLLVKALISPGGEVHYLDIIQYFGPHRDIVAFMGAAWYTGTY